MCARWAPPPPCDCKITQLFGRFVRPRGRGMGRSDASHPRRPVGAGATTTGRGFFMSRKRLGALALLASIFVIIALPGGSFGALNLRQSADELKQAGAKVQAGLQATVQK